MRDHVKKYRKFYQKKKKRLVFELNLKGGEDLNKGGGYSKLREQHEQKHRDRNCHGQFGK